MPIVCPHCGVLIHDQDLVRFGVVPDVTAAGADAEGGERTARVPERGSPAGGGSYTLEVIDGNEPGKSYPLKKPRITIGRQACDIVLDDPEISRHQATIYLDAGQPVLEDAGSTNGSFVQGLRIQRCPLQNQSEFRMGTHQLRFVASSLAEDGPPS